MTSSMNRRTLVKGAAWAAPVVAASWANPAIANAASVPSYAASGNKVIYEDSCTSAYLGYASSGSKIEQWFSNRGHLGNLPAGVSVSKVTVVHYMSTISDTGTWSGHIHNFAGWNNSKLSLSSTSNVTINKSAKTVTYPLANASSGWSNVMAGGATANHAYGNGGTYMSSSLTSTWNAAQGSSKNYATNADGTREFDTFNTGYAKFMYSITFPRFTGRVDYPGWDAAESVYTYTLVDASGNTVGTVTRTAGSKSNGDNTFSSWDGGNRLDIVNDSASNPLHGYTVASKVDNDCKNMAGVYTQWS